MNEKTSRVALILGAFLAGLVLFFAAIMLVTGYAPSPVGQAVAAVGGPFQLEDQSGKAVTDADMKGKPFLVFFGFTHCPDICPTTLFDMSQLMKELGPDADRTGALFITVDPKRDTPAVVQQYAAAFGPSIEGLTGTPEEIATVAKEYRVYYAVHRTGPGANDYSMDHSSVLYLMDPNGRFVAPVRADQSGDEIAANLKKLMG